MIVAAVTSSVSHCQSAKVHGVRRWSDNVREIWIQLDLFLSLIICELFFFCLFRRHMEVPRLGVESQL